ncbi:hypothetical protein D3C80_1671810 [compost metagenome]
MRNRGRRGYHLGGGERLGQRVEAEVVVRVAMADVDGGKPLAACTQALDHLFSLRLAELGVDQDGIVGAADNHRTDWENGLVPRVVDLQLQRLGSQGRAGQRNTGQ